MKAGYITILGRPNVGKSTVLNRLLGTKLSIVSKRPQTTRNRILGILTEGDCQCYFLDTPGLIQPRYALQNVLVDQIKKAVADADIILWVVDPSHKPGNEPDASFLDFTTRTVLCIINKIDLIPRSKILPLIDTLASYAVKEIIPVSALTGEGFPELKRAIFSNLPEGPFLYPEEDISDKPVRFFVAEIIREKVFSMFREEIPYSTCVVIEDFREREEGKDFIRAVIYVERKSQRIILIGKKGATLKKVGEMSRKEIERFLERPVYLELWVKIKEKWRKNKAFLKDLGY
jgi:GTP-binding protein Era